MQGSIKLLVVLITSNFIGSSVNIRKRFKSHKYNLKKNTHHSPYLQNCYFKYGLESLQFDVLEVVVDLKCLREKEYNYIKNLNPEFNTIKEISTILHKFSDEDKKNRSVVKRQHSKNKISKTSTQTTGVRYSQNKDRFIAYISTKDVTTPLGSYKTYEEAVKARIEGERVYWSEDYVSLTDAEKGVIREHNNLIHTRSKSGYKNISYNNKRRKYVVEVRCEVVGAYETLEEALEVRNSYYPKLPEHLKHLILQL